MEILALVPFLALAAGFAAWMARVEQERREREYRLAAERLGISWHAAGLPFSGRSAGVRGTLRGFRVSTEEFAAGKQRGVRVTVDGVGTPAGSVPATLELERERLTLGVLAGEDVVVGDPGFDERVRVRGGAAVALAALSRGARSAFLGALAAGDAIAVHAGVVVTDLKPPPEAARLAAAIRRAVRVARHLAVSPGDLGAALATRAVSDSLPGVRLQALEALAALEGEAGRPAGVARRLLGDRDAEVRLRAAVHAGDEGFETLADLVRSGRGLAGSSGRAPRRYALAEALDRSPEGNGRRQARALDRLVEAFPPGRVAPVLLAALQGGAEELRVAALRGVARSRDPFFEDAALSHLGDPSGAVRDAAVAALGAVGTAAAVPALHALAAGSGGFEFQLRREVAAAVAEIQSRIGGDAGRLSLAASGAAGGELALAAGEAGGRLSPAGEA